MSRLNWDQDGQRHYETGLDRGVLYLSDGTGVAWNGLTSVNEEGGGESTTPTYFDGIKYADIPTVGDFEATLTAFTYPHEFEQFEGVEDLGGGLYVDNQPVGMFSLSYRTLIGNDLENEDFGYKIHLIYNLTAVPDTKTLNTLGQIAELTNFSWRISAIPEDAPGYRPTAHIIFDTRYMHPMQVKQLEEILYGNDTTDAQLPDLTYLIEDWHLITITDHGDGTWSATGPEELVHMLDATTFEIIDVEGTYLDPDSYEISTTG